MVYGEATVVVFTTVHAKSKQDALKIAEKRNMGSDDTKDFVLMDDLSSVPIDYIFDVTEETTEKFKVNEEL